MSDLTAMALQCFRTAYRVGDGVAPLSKLVAEVQELNEACAMAMADQVGAEQATHPLPNARQTALGSILPHDRPLDEEIPVGYPNAALEGE